MALQTDKEQLLGWIAGKPGLLGKLQRMREMEGEGILRGLDAMEMEMLALVKEMGAEQLGHCVQAGEREATEREQATGGGRIHGKKN